MNIKQLLVIAAISATAGSAFAQQAEFVAADANFAPSKTRAEVMAEVNQAYLDGTLGTQINGAGEQVMVATTTNHVRTTAHADVAPVNQSSHTGS